MGFRYRASVVALIAIVLLASTAFTSTAFSSAEIERSATVSVSGDDAALLALIDGHPGGGLVQQGGDGTLDIDFRRGGAEGPNEDARFELGDAASPAGNHAFRIVNNGDRPKDVEVEFALTMAGDPDPGTANVEFRFYHGSDPAVTISEQSGDTQATIQDVPSGDAVYVVVVIDTRGITASSDLTGDLAVTASGA